MVSASGNRLESLAVTFMNLISLDKSILLPVHELQEGTYGMRGMGSGLCQLVRHHLSRAFLYPFLFWSYLIILITHFTTSPPLHFHYLHPRTSIVRGTFKHRSVNQQATSFGHLADLAPVVPSRTRKQGLLAKVHLLAGYADEML
jgi:hypothetical protein